MLLNSLADFKLNLSIKTLMYRVFWRSGIRWDVYTNLSNCSLESRPTFIVHVILQHIQYYYYKNVLRSV